jgi:hypothetical protein
VPLFTSVADDLVELAGTHGARPVCGLVGLQQDAASYDLSTGNDTPRPSTS